MGDAIEGSIYHYLSGPSLSWDVSQKHTTLNWCQLILQRYLQNKPVSLICHREFLCGHTYDLKVGNNEVGNYHETLRHPLMPITCAFQACTAPSLYIPFLFYWIVPTNNQPYGLLDLTTLSSMWVTQVLHYLVFYGQLFSLYKGLVPTQKLFLKRNIQLWTTRNRVPRDALVDVFLKIHLS